MGWHKLRFRLRASSLSPSLSPTSLKEALNSRSEDRETRCRFRRRETLQMRRCAREAIECSGIFDRLKNVALGQMLASTEDVLERAVTGKVKWYSMRRRYGFIQRDDGAKDIFVHQISRRKSRMVKAYLLKGAQVQFDVVDVGSGIQADKIRTCVRTPNGEQQGGSVVSELTKNSHLSIHSGKNFGTEGRCLCSWHIPAYRWCKDVALCPCRIAREKNKNLEGCMPECQCWCGVTLPVSRYGVVAGRTPRYLSLGAPRQARRSQGRRLWEMQKDQFETTRKKKEAKLKEKMEEDAKRKKKEEFEEHKRLKEEELERQRQLEIMRTRDTKVILTESVSRDDSPPASRSVKVEPLKPAPWVLKSDKSDMRNLRDIQLEEERRAMEQMKIDKERKEAFRKTQAAEASKMWSNSSSRLNWGGAAAPAWGGAGVHSPPVHAMFDGPALVAAPTAPKPKEQEKAAASAPVKVAKKSDQPKKIAPKDDPLSKWVIQRVKKLDSSVEADVFAGFIRDVVSPNEVEDYIFSYFGETNQSKEFCKEFISRRSELHSKNKAPDRDDLSRPAQAAQTPMTNPAPSATQATAAGKKKKKGKGIKLPLQPSRINAGEIDVVENAW